MKKEEIKKSSKMQLYRGVFRNGLFFYRLRNRLAHLGIDIKPYYWVQENCDICDLPIIKDDSSKYIFKILSIDEIKLISTGDFDEIVLKINNGTLIGIGLENNDSIVSYMFIELNDFEYSGKKFQLKANEAFLCDMQTFHAYRGRNLAPYLRYQAYELLNKQGRDLKYSVTQYFNKSSIRFKNKLNSKHLYCYLSIVLFKKFTWNFTLKKYD